MSKNILITGASGFLGSFLIPALEKQGHNIYTFTSKDGDIAEAELNYDEIDHIFHLAAKTFVPDSWGNPKGFYKTNVMGTTNVLDFAKKKAASVTILSSYIYGEPQYLPVDEKHPVGPYNPYCQTKIISEEIALFYHDKFGVDCTIFRPFNIYGSNQNKSFLIPTIVDQVLDKASSEINLMSLNPKRDYIHVLDVVDALMLSTELKGFSTYNLGSGASYSVKEIVNLTQQIAGTNKAILSSGTERKNEVMDVRADISKIEKELNWQPKISIQEGLKLLVQDSKFSL